MGNKIKDDIFDIENISDLPDSIKKFITRKKRSGTIQDNIIELLKMKNGATNKEIVAAYCRKYEERSPKSLQQTLYNMVLRKLIIKKGKIYMLLIEPK